MKINQILEQKQIDELGLKDIGKGIGKTVGAVGTGIGGIKGAYKGVKDAYSASRDKAAAAAQKTIGKAGGAKYPKVNQAQTTQSSEPVQPTQTPVAAPTVQSPEVANQVKTLRTQAATLTKQADALEKSQSISTTTAEPAEPDQPGGIANAVTGALKGAQSAWERGTHTPLGASLVVLDVGKEKNRVTVKDRSGKPLNYSKVGNQWVDAAGAPVADPATVAMLDQQAKAKPTTAQQPAGTAGTAGTAAPGAPSKQEPITIGGQKIMPNDPAYAKIMKGAQPAQTPAAIPAPQDQTTTTPAAPVKSRTGGKVAGQLSQTPGAIRKRQARASSKAGTQAGAGAFGQMAAQLGVQPAATTAPTVGPGVMPQMTVAPSKVTYKMPTVKPVPTAPAPVAESIDLAEVLWRKMKSKR